MKSSNQHNQILSQERLPFYNNDELGFLAKIFIMGLIVISIILSFPIFTHGAETDERIPVLTTEKNASLDMVITESATTTNSFILKISANPHSQAINAVGSYINFSTSTLEATEIDFENSFCDLFIENSIDNEIGRINIICGKPYPGVSEEATIAEISFKRLSTASSSVEFDTSSMVLANDGFGTNVLGKINNLK